MTNKYEKSKYRKGYKYIIGCDEVGKGSLAGPVVAAAVALPQVESSKLKVQSWKDVKDSKLLLSQKREELSLFIKSEALAWAMAEVHQETIDKINIHNATLLAMKKAAEKVLGQVSSQTANILVAVDGKFAIPKLNVPQEAVVDGDNKILSIAAASILAKVHRDNLMCRLHRRYPLYNFAKHKGYGTLYHRDMIIKHGVSPIHRLTFCKNLAV